MVKKTKELRVKIDGLAQLTRGLEPLNTSLIIEKGAFNSKEINEAVDSLFLAKAWLGKVLGGLGTESPYPKDGSRKTVEDIEPTADRVSDQIIIKYPDSLLCEPDPGNGEEPQSREPTHIEKVDWLRQEISKMIGEADILMSQKGRVYIFGCNINQHLSEARFWLGFELERIREEEA